MNLHVVQMAAWLGNSLRLLALAVLTVLGVAAASPAVVQLQADTIDEITAKSSDTWIIEFFAPWCGHCQKLLPKFEEAAKAARKAKLPVRFGKVDCEDEDSKSLCKVGGNRALVVEYGACPATATEHYSKPACAFIA